MKRMKLWILWAALLLAPVLGAMAQEAAAAAPAEPVKKTSLWDLIVVGGWAMWPLGACSFVWVSALLATPGGYRLGTGGGWYDRALAHADPDAVRGTLVGEAELVDAVPLEPWDLPVDLVVTPSATIVTGARGVRTPSEE